MAAIDTDDLISISEANRLGVSGLVRAAEAGRERVVLRNNKPVAAIVSIQRFEQLQTLQDDLTDLSLVAARMLTDDGRRAPLDEVLDRYGVTRDQLRDLPE